MDNNSLRYDELPDFLTVKELRQYLRIGHNKAYELANRPDFPKIPFGNKKVFPKKAVKEWMEHQSEKGRLPKKLRAI